MSDCQMSDVYHPVNSEQYMTIMSPFIYLYCVLVIVKAL